jgi:uncharacterized phage-like protein YoqJ
MIYAGTGHRPNKLGGYEEIVSKRLLVFAETTLEQLSPPPSLIISGMALGWDQALAEAATNLCIPWDAYIPFVGQDVRWPEGAREKYHWLINQARKLVVVSPPGYAPKKMHIRNEAMVRACDAVLALYDGSPGGTQACVTYAKLRGKPIINLWQDWRRMNDGPDRAKV